MRKLERQKGESLLDAVARDVRIEKAERAVIVAAERWATGNDDGRADDALLAAVDRLRAARKAGR